jgi:hypothetical protein
MDKKKIEKNGETLWVIVTKHPEVKWLLDAHKKSLRGETLPPELKQKAEEWLRVDRQPTEHVIGIPIQFMVSAVNAETKKVFDIFRDYDLLDAMDTLDDYRRGGKKNPILKKEVEF